MDDFQVEMFLVLILYLTLVYEIIDGWQRRKEIGEKTCRATLSKKAGEEGPKKNYIQSKSRHKNNGKYNNNSQMTSRRFIQMRIVSRS